MLAGMSTVVQWQAVEMLGFLCHVHDEPVFRKSCFYVLYTTGHHVKVRRLRVFLIFIF